jgi:hypothetical protein
MLFLKNYNLCNNSSSKSPKKKVTKHLKTHNPEISHRKFQNVTFLECYKETPAEMKEFMRRTRVQSDNEPGLHGMWGTCKGVAKWTDHYVSIGPTCFRDQSSA